MPLTPSQRNQIANYKIQIERYRADLDRIKEDKKKKSDYYANLIKSTTNPVSKRSYRQSKITAMNSFVNQIDSKKKDIERIKGFIKNIKS